MSSPVESAEGVHGDPYDEPMAEPQAKDAPTPGNRERLIELSAQIFADDGFAAGSVRDLAKRLDMTTGAIYSNFRNKGDLLAAAVDLRVQQNMEQMRDAATVPEFVAEIFEQSEERTQMRALLLEAAVAARTDPKVREQVKATQEPRFESWAAAYADWMAANDVSEDIDPEALLTVLWSIELGLGVLEAMGIERSTPDQRAVVIRKLLEGLEGASA
jgi:AcrR family transcriptional regulator